MMRRLLLAWVVVLGWGCAPQSPDQAAVGEAPEPPPGERLPEQAEPAQPDPWIRAVAEAHALADTAQDPAAVAQAIVRLSAAFEAGPDLPAATPARQDLAGRIAALQLDGGRLDDAREWVVHGLALPVAPTVFTAHLHLLSARIFERQGRVDEAAAARAQARTINRDLAGARR